MVNKKIPLRKCIGCNEMFPKKELVRIVHTPEDEVVLDFQGKKNGRGTYLCKNVSCLLMAIKTKAISRAFKIDIPEETYSTIIKELEEVCDGQ